MCGKTGFQQGFCKSSFVIGMMGWDDGVAQKGISCFSSRDVGGFDAVSSIVCLFFKKKKEGS